MIQDVRVEKDESHPGKVVERRWYERNKHIFPASRWEVYDPNISREGKGYTVHGDEIAQKKGGGGGGKL
jgi:protein FAM50